MANVQGTCVPRFQKVKDLLDQKITSQEETGAAICVNIDGENVVDLWGGHADAARTRPWEKDTIAPIWSTTKCITSLAAILLIDRGLLDPEEKVSKYWPEFAANGKQDVLVRHILSHSSGVPAWNHPVTPEFLFDVPRSTEELAGQEPWWTPGTASGYHLVAFGTMIGELVRRVSGKTLDEFVKSEIVEPLGNADFHLSIDADDEANERIAEITPPPMPDFGAVDPNSIVMRAIIGSSIPGETANTPGFRKAPLGGMGGLSNARGVVQILSTITRSGSPSSSSSSEGNTSKNLLSEKTVLRIFDEQVSGTDLVLLQPVTFGLGFALTPGKPGEVAWLPAGGHKCWWVGWGGSIGLVDLENKMTVSYVPNLLGEGLIGSARTEAYMRAIYSALGDV